MEVQDFKVLIVEDSPIISIVMEDMFTIMGCSTVVAATGKEALELFQSDYYHLILMDVGLPDSDGFTLSKIIRSSSDAKRANTPIVIITAHTTTTTYIEQIKELAIKDFIVKPCTLDMCKKLVTKYQIGYPS
jgi:two-component system aerobic respiration control sensor histidine kinase ArcB